MMNALNKIPMVRCDMTAKLETEDVSKQCGLSNFGAQNLNFKLCALYRTILHGAIMRLILVTKLCANM
jgi:hypothetical protein